MNRVTRKIKTLMGRSLLLIFVGCCLSAAAFAETLETYSAKVTSARDFADEVEASIRAKQASDVKTFTAQLRRDFPSSERIEWNGGIVETSNDWLLEKARALDQAVDPVVQLPVIIELREHLSAVAFKLDELKNSTASARTKDEDKRKLAEILRREEYQKPQEKSEKSESLFQRWLREFLEWLESLLPKSGPTMPITFGVLPMILQFLLYAALLGLLGYLVYKVAPVLFPNLKRARKPRKEKERIILGERLGDDVTATDLLGEAERLAREGNLRGAIRKGYIALLCDLSDRKVIGLSHNKTNRDYLRDVRSRRELHPRMKVITDTFERHWYGLQESAEQDWARFREEYKEAIRTI